VELSWKSSILAETIKSKLDLTVGEVSDIDENARYSVGIVFVRPYGADPEIFKPITNSRKKKWS
jgi:hypothetical protein